MGNVFLAHIGLVNTNQSLLECHSHLNIDADHMATIYPASNGYFQPDNAPCHKAKVISN